MGAKATFNATTRIIKLTETPDADDIVNLDVQVDLYGDQKEDWLSTPALRKVRPPISVIGGQSTPTGALGGTYFLRSDWKIEPYDADHRLIVSGNLFSQDGTSVFIKPTGGTYAVFTEMVVSNIVDQVEAVSNLTAANVWEHLLESTMSAEQMMRIMAAALWGKASGLDTNSPVYRSIFDNKDRITATTDQHGNRSSVTMDGS